MNAERKRPVFVTPADAMMLEKYVGGRVRDPDDDYRMIHRMRENGFLECETDGNTGVEFLTTTEAGIREVEINNGPARIRFHRMIAFMLNAEDYW